MAGRGRPSPLPPAAMQPCLPPSVRSGAQDGRSGEPAAAASGRPRRRVVCCPAPTAPPRISGVRSVMNHPAVQTPAHLLRRARAHLPGTSTRPLSHVMRGAAACQLLLASRFQLPDRGGPLPTALRLLPLPGQSEQRPPHTALGPGGSCPLPLCWPFAFLGVPQGGHPFSFGRWQGP